MATGTKARIRIGRQVFRAAIGRETAAVRRKLLTAAIGMLRWSAGYCLGLALLPDLTSVPVLRRLKRTPARARALVAPAVPPPDLFPAPGAGGAGCGRRAGGA